MQAQALDLAQVLAARKSALTVLNVRDPKTLQVQGDIVGSGLVGRFRSWQDGDMERITQGVGVSEGSEYRLGTRRFLVDAEGEPHELHGILLRRERTADFIDDDDFVTQPQYDTFKGAKTLHDGRLVYEIVVAPQDGQPETVDLDAKTFMIDRISYEQSDGTATEDYYDYRLFDGVLLAQREVDSNGDHAFDMTRLTQRVLVDAPIKSSVFDVPAPVPVQTDRPVTVPLTQSQGHYFTMVHVGNADYRFLVDTGAQGIIVDTRVAQEQHLHVQGHLEVSGAHRIGGLGMAAIDGISIGKATLPLKMVSVLDLGEATGRLQADGVLGYPFFAAAEVTIDAAHDLMTIAKPGSMNVHGQILPVDTDRELVEIHGSADGTPGRFIVDTGDSSELLIFNWFANAHPQLIPFGSHRFATNYGVGGSVRAIAAIIDELDLGSFRLYNRYANIMLAQKGAFADTFDAGNIGMATLANFIVTFDLQNERMYLQQGAAFDDGRDRPRNDTVKLPF